jgi:hypothetical protein
MSSETFALKGPGKMVSVFQGIYYRANSKKKHKPMNCFPTCHKCGHLSNGNCGNSVDCVFPYDGPKPAAAYAYGEFLDEGDIPICAVGESVPGAAFNHAEV